MRLRLAGVALAATLAGAVGTAGASTWPPEPPPHLTTAAAVREHPILRAKVARIPASIRDERGIALGRNQLHEGRARDGRVVWRRVREQVNAYLAALHPDADYALRRAYAANGDLLYVARRVWRRAGVPEELVEFYSCVPRHEGGLDVMDRWHGPGLNLRGWATGVRLGFVGTNRVADPWQVRPGWVRGYRAGHPGSYLLPDRWDRGLFALATDPVAAADLVRYVGPEQFATRAACS